MKKTKGNLLFILVVLVLLFFNIKQFRKIASIKENFAIANYDLKITKDKHNREVAVSSVLQLERKKINKIAAFYKSKYDLEKIKPGKVTYLQHTKIQTKFDTIIKTQVSYTDTMPIYTITDSSKWHYIKVVAMVDSSNVYWAVNNEFISTHTNTSTFWNAPKYEIITTNLNPNTQTTERHTYKFKPKKANRLLWFGAGFLLNALIIK